MQTPGPGQYIQPGLLGQASMNNLTVVQEIKRSSSMFISKTKRGVSASSTNASKPGKHAENNGVLQYDVESKTINA